MTEIYEKYAKEYDELVEAEDYERSLDAALFRIAEWNGRFVFEAGTGTGRVTQLYIGAAGKAVCCDRSSHMLSLAKRKLSNEDHKIMFTLADNLALPAYGTADIFIEGWSFGHCITANSDHIPETTAQLLRSAEGTLKRGGMSILIETMGTNAKGPGAPHQALAAFYELLETEYGFTSLTIRTDYEFPNVGEAARITGFFFGPAMAEAVMQNGSAIVPEWTGLWYRCKD